MGKMEGERENYKGEEEKTADCRSNVSDKMNTFSPHPKILSEDIIHTLA